MDNNQLIKQENHLLQKVGNAISVTNKLLALAEAQLIPYRKGDKWGFCTPDKNIVIDCMYDDAFPFSNGLAIVKLNGKYGAITQNGNHKISFNYDFLFEFCDNVAIAVLINQEGNSYFLIDKNENILTKCYYSYINSSSTKGEKMYVVKLNNKYGLIDKNGKEILPCIYESLLFGSENSLVSVKINSKEGVFDFDNNTFIIEPTFNMASVLSKDYIFLSSNTESFCVNSKFERVRIDTEEHASLYEFGLRTYPNKDMKYCYYDILTRNIIIDYKYDDAGLFKNGLAKVKIKNKFGYIDKDENEKVPIKYEEVGDFMNDSAYFKLDKKYGYLNRNGVIVIPNFYDEAGDFTNSIAFVKFKNKKGYINEQGVQYWED